jgi:DNA-binding phage protein
MTGRKEKEMKLDILHRMMMTQLHLERPAMVKEYCNHCMTDWGNLSDREKEFINHAYKHVVGLKRYE